MGQLSRRSFIKGATAAVATGGAAAALPMTAASAATTPIEKRAQRAMNLAEGASVHDPIVAHVRDVHTGEVSIYFGKQEVKVKDRHVAALLYAATKEAR